MSTNTKEVERKALTGPRQTKLPGSVEWCLQSMDYFKLLFKHLADDEKHNTSKFYEILTELEEHKVWEKVPLDTPYGSLNNMLVKEIGFNLDIIKDKARFRRQMISETHYVPGDGVKDVTYKAKNFSPEAIEFAETMLEELPLIGEYHPIGDLAEFFETAFAPGRLTLTTLPHYQLLTGDETPLTIGGPPMVNR